jgi:hypothetical protein
MIGSGGWDQLVCRDLGAALTARARSFLLDLVEKGSRAPKIIVEQQGREERGREVTLRRWTLSDRNSSEGSTKFSTAQSRIRTASATL